jgi:hypothetical protein
MEKRMYVIVAIAGSGYNIGHYSPGGVFYSLKIAETFDLALKIANELNKSFYGTL